LISLATLIKCTPEDLHTFYTQSTERYTTFIQPATPKEIGNALTISASTQLSTAMGLSKASTNLDLPYQTLFPSKSQQQQQQQKVNGNSNRQSQQQNEAQVLPFTSSGPSVPFSLSESSTIWMNHLYISLSSYQIIHERDKAVHRWELHGKNNLNEKDDEWNGMIFDNIKSKQAKEKIRQIEHLYVKCKRSVKRMILLILLFD
jgi:hypothetical protein